MESKPDTPKKWFKFLQQSKWRNRLDRFVMSFSLKRNIKKLFASRKYAPEDHEFEIFNAFKVISISIIVLGNTYFYTLSGPI